MLRIEFFFFKMFVLLSIFHDVVFATPVGKFRLLHFCIPVMYVIVFRHIKVVVRMKKYRKYFIVLFSALCYGGLTYFTSKFQSGTIRIFFSMILNFAVFYFFLFFLEIHKSRIGQILLFLKKFVLFLCVLTLLQWLGALIHIVPISQPGEGFLAVGRPDLFFNDPNWLAFYIVFAYMMVDVMSQWCGLNVSSRYRLVVFIALLFIQSRILLLCFAMHYVYCVAKYRKAWSLIPFVLLLLVCFTDTSILINVLPERFVYDLVDSDNNPRWLDVMNISGEVQWYHRERFGMGWGSLGSIADDFPYRNYDITINVWPGQIYFDFGIVGVCGFALVFLYTIFKVKGTTFKVIFVFFIINCCFHMPGYFLFTWVLLGLFVYTYKNSVKVTVK